MSLFLKRCFLLASCAVLLLAGVKAWRWAKASGVKSLSSSRLEMPRVFIGLNPASGYEAYGRRIHQLGRDVPQDEQRRLANWIRTPKSSGFEENEGAWHWLVNEVMTALCHQNAPLPEWSDILTGLANDPSRNLVIRDYALQHMVDWLQPNASGEHCETNLTKREAMVKSLAMAAKDGTKSYAGTAILGLHLALHLGELKNKSIEGEPAEPWRPETPFDVAELCSITLNLLQRPDSCAHARISALQVCAQRGFTEALPFARCIVTDPQSANPLKLSAIAALGALGTSDDRLLLNQISLDKNAHLARAIEPACKAITRRLADAQNL